MPSVDDCSRTAPPPPTQGWLECVGISGWLPSESPAGLRRNAGWDPSEYAAAAISRRILPANAAPLGQELDVPVARAVDLRIARAYHRRGAGRDDDVWWWIRLPGCCRRIRGFTVIGAVCGHGGDLALRLPKQRRHLGRVVGVALGQHVGCDLAGDSVHGEMQLPPSPARPAVLLCVPLTLPEQFQACLSSTRWIVPAPAMTRGCRPANTRPRRLSVEWSGTDSSSPSRRRTLRANPSPVARPDGTRDAGSARVQSPGRSRAAVRLASCAWPPPTRPMPLCPATG